jgi:hypothetical protein
MAKILYVHWNEAELEARVAPLKAAGHEVLGHWNQEKQAKFGKDLPDAVVIALDRLPSHGRAIAEWFWEAKNRQHIPLLFAGGKPEKIEETRSRFPKAGYCGTDGVVEALAEILLASRNR